MTGPWSMSTLKNVTLALCFHHQLHGLQSGSSVTHYMEYHFKHFILITDGRNTPVRSNNNNKNNLKLWTVTIFLRWCVEGGRGWQPSCLVGTEEEGGHLVLHLIVPQVLNSIVHLGGNCSARGAFYALYDDYSCGDRQTDRHTETVGWDRADKHSSEKFTLIKSNIVTFSLSACQPLCLPLWMSVSLSACQQVYLSVSLSVCLWGCLLACQPVCLSVCIWGFLSACLSVFRDVCQPVCLLVSLSVCLSICLSVSLSVCLWGCLSVSLCVFGDVCQSVCVSLGMSVSLSAC